MRSFSHRTTNKNSYVHVHTRDKHYSPATSGVGASRDFYSDADNTTADDLITNLEEKQQKTVKKILETGSVSDQQAASELFSLQSIRTQKFRSSLADVAPLFIEVLASTAKNEGWAIAQIETYLGRPENIKQAIDQELAKLPPYSREQKVKLKFLVSQKMKSELHLLKPAWIKQAARIAEDVFDHMIDEAKVIAETSFKKIFENPQGLIQRAEWFHRFNFELTNTGGNKLILGDCAVVAIDSNGNSKLAMTDLGDGTELVNIYLPISPSMYLVGRRGNNDFSLDSHALNKISACLSHNFFIAFQSSSEEIKFLKSILGSETGAIASSEELLKIAGSVIAP
jgi:Protein of unknown function (DUF4238)